MSTYFVVAPTKENIEQFCLLLIACLLTSTGYGRPMKPFFNDIPIFWADKFWDIWGILANYLHYFSTVSPLSMEKWIWFVFQQKTLVFRPNTFIPNMILAVKNLRNSHHTSVVGAYFLARSFILHQAFHPSSPIHKTTLSIGNPTSKFSSFALTKPLGNS